MSGLVRGEKISRRRDSRESPHARNFREVRESSRLRGRSQAQEMRHLIYLS